jgi:hypothetical protein
VPAAPDGGQRQRLVRAVRAEADAARAESRNDTTADQPKRGRGAQWGERVLTSTERGRDHSLRLHRQTLERRQRCGARAERRRHASRLHTTNQQTKGRKPKCSGDDQRPHAPTSVCRRTGPPPNNR